MYFNISDRSKALEIKLKAFMEENVYPVEKDITEEINGGISRWEPSQIIEDLKSKAKNEGLWNLFLPESDKGAGLSNLWTPFKLNNGEEGERPHRPQ